MEEFNYFITKYYEKNLILNWIFSRSFWKECLKGIKIA